MLRRPTAHEQVDNALGLGRMMRRFQNTGKRGSRGVARQQLPQSSSTEAHAAAAEEGAAIKSNHVIETVHHNRLLHINSQWRFSVANSPIKPYVSDGSTEKPQDRRKNDLNGLIPFLTSNRFYQQHSDECTAHT